MKTNSTSLAPAGCVAHKELVIRRAWDISQQVGKGAVKKVPQQGSQCLKALATKN